ncbi:hypothetical protein [Pseudaestuariivita atlantica]|nr:hypothetical protein [Pseudaestuariivita atlantica]
MSEDKMPGDTSEPAQRCGRTAKLCHFDGFDMEWSYFTASGRAAASCPTCGVRSRTWDRPEQARRKKLPYDFNDTYDGKVILSERARAYFMAHWPDQMDFRQIFENAWEAEPRRVLTVENPDEVVEYSSQYGSGDGNPCPDCGLCYCQTFKGNLYRFGNAELIAEDGVFRTDISFGHAFRSPLWLAGEKAAMAISVLFREVWLRPFEHQGDGSWEFRLDDPFRADAATGAVEPDYPDFLD